VKIDRLAALLDAHAPYGPLPAVPALSAWQARDELALWAALENEDGKELPPPFFCVAWPGAVALARAVIGGAIQVRGALVADVGCGSGVVACAAAKAGAAGAVAVDVDPLAVLAAEELARRHGVDVQGVVADALVPGFDAGVDIVLAGDLVSNAKHVEPFRAALARWTAAGVRVFVADGGRPFFDPTGLTLVDETVVPVPKGVEGVEERRVRLFASGP
jgi:predicted nicotinamide N-methyase